MIANELMAFAPKIKELNCRDRTVQFQIDGLTYTSTKWAASVGLELWPRLTALLGSAFTKGLATGDFDSVGLDAIVYVADRAIKDSLIPLVRDVLSRMSVDKLYPLLQPGKVLEQFDEHFAGEYVHLLKVCIFAIAHNIKGPTYGAH